MPKVNEGQIPELARELDKFVAEENNRKFVWPQINIPKPPIQQPIAPAPVEEEFLYHFQGMDLVIPMWTKYLSQEIDGRIIAHEAKPFKLNGAFGIQNGRWKIVVKPEPYELLLEEVVEW